MLFEGFMKFNEPKQAAEVKEEFQRRFIKCAVKFSAIQAKWESLENEVESVGLHTDPSITPDTLLWNQLMNAYQRVGLFVEAYRVWEVLHVRSRERLDHSRCMRVRQLVATRGTSDQEALGAIFPTQPRELECIRGVHVSEWDVERCCQDGVSGDGTGRMSGRIWPLLRYS